MMNNTYDDKDDDDDDFCLSDFQSECHDDDFNDNDEDEDFNNENKKEDNDNDDVNAWQFYNYTTNMNIKDHENVDRINQNDVTDFSFYKRRILNLTNELLKQQINQPPLYVHEEVNHAFIRYAKYCVDHFKEKDTCDIFQEAYSSIFMDNSLNVDAIDISAASFATQSDIDNEYVRSVQLFSKGSTFDDTEEDEHIFCPQHKHINLKDVSLKNKGISKKKKNVAL